MDRTTCRLQRAMNDATKAIEAERAIAEDIERGYWYAHGQTPLGNSDFWRPLKVVGKNVLGQTCDLNRDLAITVDEYRALRDHPLVKVGIFEFCPPGPAITDIRFAHRDPVAAGYRLYKLRQELEALKAMSTGKESP